MFVKYISKSCPHNQFVLNYGLRTKLDIARISGTSSKSGLHRIGPISGSTGQVRCPGYLNPLIGSLTPFGLQTFVNSSHQRQGWLHWRFVVPPLFYWWFLGESILSPPRIWSPLDFLHFKVFLKCSWRDLWFLYISEVHCDFFWSISL
jgi:hypothetical protein